MCGRAGEAAVEQEALVHADDPAALSEVVVEEEQVLRHTLQGETEASTIAGGSAHHGVPGASGCALTQVAGRGDRAGLVGRPPASRACPALKCAMSPPGRTC